MTNRRNITIRTTDEWIEASKQGASLLADHLRIPVSMNTFIEYAVVQYLKDAGYQELSDLAATRTKD